CRRSTRGTRRRTRCRSSRWGPPHPSRQGCSWSCDRSTIWWTARFPAEPGSPRDVRRTAEVLQDHDLRALVDELTVQVRHEVHERRLRVDLRGPAEPHGERLLLGQRIHARPPAVHLVPQPRDRGADLAREDHRVATALVRAERPLPPLEEHLREVRDEPGDRARLRKSTRLNSSHVKNSYAVFCLKKKMYSTIKCK